MNHTAIKAALHPLNAQARLYAAMRRTAILKKPSATIKGAKGQPLFVVTWISGYGFTIRDKSGRNVTKTVYSVIRGL